MGGLIKGSTAQCNLQCGHAKAMLRSQDITALPQQKVFPLEPICMFVEDTKMTSDTGAHIRYAAGRQDARSLFHKTSRMFTDTFDEVDWPQVHRTLTKEVPRLFQVWACKQVMNIAATNKNLHQRHCNGWSNKCPCCTIHEETAEHVLLCPEKGQVEVFMESLLALERWLNKVDTDPNLADSIVKYVQRRGTVSMEDIVQEEPSSSRLLENPRTRLDGDGFLKV
jgi:hypothetical protein